MLLVIIIFIKLIWKIHFNIFQYNRNFKGKIIMVISLGFHGYSLSKCWKVFRLSPCLDPLFNANIAVQFIRARSNLILSCSSEGFPIYSLFREKGGGGEGQSIRGRVVRTVIVVITFFFFLRLTSRLIFDNRKNRLPYFICCSRYLCLDYRDVSV